MKTFGSGQTNGLPLAITATTAALAQTLHTAPTGSATPNLIQVLATGTAHASGYGVGTTVTVVITDGTTATEFKKTVPFDGSVISVFSAPVALNGANLVKVYASAAGIKVTAIVDDQADTAAIISQTMSSGLVAAVQNASRYAVNAQGGTGQATEANGRIVIARAGILRNLRSVADATIGGGATVTSAIRINGATSALTQTLAAADTTVAKTNTASVTVAAGDLVTFLVVCDNAGAPAANILASVEFV